MLARLLASFTPMKPQELPNRLVNSCERVNTMQRSELPYPKAISVMRPGANRYMKEVVVEECSMRRNPAVGHRAIHVHWPNNDLTLAAQRSLALEE